MKQCIGRALLALTSVLLVLTSSVPAQEAAKVIEIHAKRFSFSPHEITICKGESVRIKLISEDVTNSLVIPALHVNQQVKKSQPVKFSLSPDSAGDFSGKCGHFCGKGHGQMTFIIHVTAK